MVERLWIIGSIVLVAALVFLACALAYIVATRVAPWVQAKARKGTAEYAVPAGAPGKAG
jgi:hypothetical protein